MPAPFRNLAFAARLLVLSVVASACAATALVSLVDPSSLDVTLFAVAAAMCAAANGYEILAPGNFSFQPNLVFFVFGAVLLPPWAIGVLAVVSHLPGALLRRPRWYMTVFNIGNYVLAGLVVHVIVHLGPSFLTSPDLIDLVRLFCAAGAAVVVNHLLVAGAIATSQHRPLSRVILGLSATLTLDLALAITGGALVVLWSDAPVLTLLAAGPMILVYQALWVPALRHKSRTDPKTGLFHADHFREQLTDGLEVAERERRTVALLMLDLDRLRAVNNRFGHLAGDELIERTARLIEQAAPDGSVAARFGGEEFSLMLPDASMQEAVDVADRIRLALEAETWSFGQNELFTATISIGVASFPEHAQTADELIGVADAALYDAKLGGRNRVRRAIPEHMGGEPRVADPDARLLSALAPPIPVAVAAPTLPTAPAVLHEAGAQDAAPGEPRLEYEAAPDVDGAPVESSVATSVRGPRPGGVLALVIALCTLAALAAFQVAASGTTIRRPDVFVLLIASFILLDHVKIDLFERGHISPAAAPVLALAFVFGPAGPLVAEVVLAAVRALKKVPPLRFAFDFGSLAMSGVAAAWTFSSIAGHHGFGVMVGACVGGLVYYAVNAGMLCLVMSLSEGARLAAIWRERLAWLWPQYLGFGLVAGAFVVLERDHGAFAILFFAIPLGLLWVAEHQYVGRSRDSVVELRRHRDELEGANTRLRGLLSTNQDLLRSMQRSYLSTITSLARTIEAKDPYTGGHTERVGDFAMLLAREIGMSERDLMAVEVGAVIHDIGKIGVPDQILLKPGRLTDDEFTEMRRHPEISSYIVSELDLPPIVKHMVRSHHERWDGAGYPDGLAGEEIPLAARILSVADTLDAMTSHRSYRAALPLSVAVEEIRANAGIQFCPRVVDAFLRCYHRDPTLGSKFAPPGREVPAEPPSSAASAAGSVVA
jgi:diguanylate cyclase (GGDEF)-like protein